MLQYFFLWKQSRFQFYEVVMKSIWFCVLLPDKSLHQPTDLEFF